MQLKLSQLEGKQGRIVRETTAPFLFIDDDGKQTIGPMKVRYFSLSTAEQAEQKEKLRASDAAGGTAYWSDILLPIIESFPELIDDATGLPAAVTKELLEKINGVNLQSIYQAIRDAPLPKLPSTK